MGNVKLNERNLFNWVLYWPLLVLPLCKQSRNFSLQNTWWIIFFFWQSKSQNVIFLYMIYQWLYFLLYQLWQMFLYFGLRITTLIFHQSHWFSNLFFVLAVPASKCYLFLTCASLCQAPSFVFHLCQLWQHMVGFFCFVHDILCNWFHWVLCQI